MPRIAQIPPPGVKRNGTPEASPGAWWDMNMMRWRGGVLQPIGGNVAMPAALVPDPIRDILTWHDNTGTRWAAIGTDAKLYAYNFDLHELHDITPTGVGGLEAPGALVGYGMGDYGTDAYGVSRDPSDIGPTDISGSLGDIWSMDTFGERLLIVPTQDGHLYVWDPTTPTTLPVLVTAAPDQNQGVIVTDQRHVVLLGAGADPRNIAWSDQEDYNVWAPDVTNLAGSKRLVTQAHVQSALKVAQGILIFTSNDLHLMTYVGPPYAYGIVQVAAGCGPLSLRAPVSIGSMAVWPSLQNWWIWNGNSQPLNCDVKDWFFSLLNYGGHGKLFGSVNPQFSEVWFDWPDEGSIECNRYVVFNYGATPQPIWLIGQRSRTAADRLGVLDHPILGGPLGSEASLYFHEYGTNDNGAPLAATGAVYAETGNIAMGEGDKRWNCTQVVMDGVTDPAAPSFGFRFFLKEQALATTEFDTGLYTVVHDGLMDVRFSGRSVRMRVEGTADTAWALGRTRLEASLAGRR